jgi:hypothetical protein
VTVQHAMWPCMCVAGVLPVCGCSAIKQGQRGHVAKFACCLGLGQACVRLTCCWRCCHLPQASQGGNDETQGRSAETPKPVGKTHNERSSSGVSPASKRAHTAQQQHVPESQQLAGAALSAPPTSSAQAASSLQARFLQQLGKQDGSNTSQLAMDNMTSTVQHDRAATSPPPEAPLLQCLDSQLPADSMAPSESGEPAELQLILSPSSSSAAMDEEAPGDAVAGGTGARGGSTPRVRGTSF